MKLGLFGLLFVMGLGAALGYGYHDPIAKRVSSVSNMVGDTPRTAASKLSEALNAAK
jgi:hypothetical protein